MNTASNLLVGGVSGIGKSTLLREVARQMKGVVIQGLLSEAIIESGLRVGWRIESLQSGVSEVLAHIAMPLQRRMGRFGVDLGLFDRLALQELKWDSQVNLYIVDEIGVISSWSSAFPSLFDELLNATTPVIASIRQKSTPYGDHIRTRPDVDIVELAANNFAELEAFATSWVEARLRFR